MQTFVALMRGINVGSARKLPMGDLRALCGSLGLERPQTYIQSGNLLVEAKGGEAALRRLLEKELADRFGFTVDVIVRTAAEWEGYVAANPFTGDAKALPKMLHLYLPCDPLKSRAAKALSNGHNWGSGLVQQEERFGSIMGRTASRDRNSARFSSIGPAVRRRPAAIGIAS